MSAFLIPPFWMSLPCFLYSGKVLEQALRKSSKNVRKTAKTLDKLEMPT
jgi:hypothetical protein